VTVLEGPLIFFQFRHDLKFISYLDNPWFNSGKGAVFNVDGKVSSIHVFMYLFFKCVLNKTIDRVGSFCYALETSSFGY
jgi:hypothetical protein